MLPLQEILFFILAAFLLVISPGPNMIYLISRSITQGKKAGLISLAGVMCGFMFHITMVSFGLTAVLFAVPYAFTILKFLGVLYLFYLAYQAIKPGASSVFITRNDLPKDKPRKLFMIGFLTNVLNPKVAVFYLSLFPQFIKPEYGNVMLQSFQLGMLQIMVSFTINFCIVLTAARMASFFATKPLWLKAQKWFMATVLVGLAVKMAFSKAK
jgi:threonine/homoserine/homoserine lactone efflux protein